MTWFGKERLRLQTCPAGYLGVTPGKSQAGGRVFQCISHTVCPCMSKFPQRTLHCPANPCHTALKNDLLCSLCATSVWPPTTWLPEGHASISEAFRRRAQKRQAMATKSSNVMGGFGKSGFFWANAGGIRGNVCGMFRSIRISSNLIA